MVNLSTLIICILLCSFSSYFYPEKGKVKSFDAQWISALPENLNFDSTYAAPYFRKEFNVTGRIKSAQAKVTGVGYYEFYLNGKKVGDHLLAPAFTRYDKRVKYNVFDVTDYLVKGENAAGGILGNGFYNVHTRSAWDFNKAPWRNVPAFICQIEIEYQSGKKEIIITDESWKFSSGPIVFDQIRNGETYDATKELSGWAKSGFDDSSWKASYTGNGPKGMFSKELMPPIRKTRTLKPTSVSEPIPGIYVVDFGQNISGWVKLKVNEPVGTEIIMKHGERIFDNGRLDNQELSRFIFTGETQTTRYISNGNKDQEYEPRFSYFGFQYVEVSGLTEKLKVDDIEAYMINTDFDEVGYFECSNELFNKVHDMIKWSYLGNYHGFPEDCPHREKMGWTGDAQLVVNTALLNFDAKLAYIKYLEDHQDAQKENGDLPGIIPTSGWGYVYQNSPNGYGPHWEGSVIVIPWNLYLHSADISVLKRFYPMMKKYLLHLENISENYLLNFGIDDHKSIKTHTDGPYISSAYFCWLSGIMSQVANALEKDIDADRFVGLQSKIAKSFHSKYFNTETITYGNGGQTQMALALSCGIVPDEIKTEVFENFLTAIEKSNHHFDCGVVGLRKIIDVLIDFDRKDILYKMASQKDFPSFGYWIEQGANTMWQNWDGSQSRNHIMFGSIGDYFYNGLSGIKTEDSFPGFEKIKLKPQFPENIEYLKCGHKTPYGWIKVNWTREGKSICYKIELPEETTTELILPKGEGRTIINNKDIKEIEAVDLIKSDSGLMRYHILPGNYIFNFNTD